MEVEEETEEEEEEQNGWLETHWGISYEEAKDVRLDGGGRVRFWVWRENGVSSAAPLKNKYMNK